MAKMFPGFPCRLKKAQSLMLGKGRSVTLKRIVTSAMTILIYLLQIAVNKTLSCTNTNKVTI